MIKGKIANKLKRKARIRKKVSGSALRPRLSVFKSNRHFILQVIDDNAGNTLVSASTLEKELRDKVKNNNIPTAERIALAVAERAKAKGISKMVFDRNGNAYHGKMKKIADSLRENGIQI